MNKNKFVFLVFFSCLSVACYSQGEKYLVLDKPGHIKRIRYYVGDELSFKLTGEKRIYKDVIEAVSDSSIKIRGTLVPIKDITAIIRYREGGLLNQAIYILPRAGILYFLADTFNPIFYGGEVAVSRSGIVVGSSLIAGSLVLRLFTKKTYRINNYRTLRVLETF